MPYRPMYTTQDITNIALNSQSVSRDYPIPTGDLVGYKVINLTGVTILLKDDQGHIIDVVPGTTFSQGKIDNPTNVLHFVFDNTVQTNASGTPYTSNNNWQIWVELSTKPFEPKMSSI